MKRLFLTIGLMLLPASLHAQALSPWVQEVLNRADVGMVFANSMPYSSCNDETIQSEISNNQSLIRELMVPAISREAEVELLRESTVCFQSDRHLLALKIRAVQNAMLSAIESCKTDTTKALREVYRFLVGAYNSFLIGGTNPAYTNDLLRYRYPFHDVDLWEASARDPVPDTDSTAPLCPYTTDYGVHSIGFIPTPVGGGAAVGTSGFDVRSFGCDATVLAAIPAPFDREATTLREFMEKTTTVSTSLFATVSTALFNLDHMVSILTGTLPGAQVPGPKTLPPHDVRTGCLRPLEPDFIADSPAEVDAILSAYPDYFEAYYLRDDGSGAFTYNPPTEDILPTGILHLPVVDFFLTTPNAGIITRSYIDKRENIGLTRPLPNYLVSQMFDSFLNAITRTADTGTRLRQIAGNIEREMGIFESANTDALQRKQDASVPLESAVQSLINVVDTELPEKYIPSLAYFLARSCVDGHCQRTLDAVLKRTFNPYCHPFVSGKYVDPDAAKRCYCDPEVQSIDPGFWQQYCSNNVAEDIARYNALPAVFVPACMEEIPL